MHNRTRGISIRRSRRKSGGGLPILKRYEHEATEYEYTVLGLRQGDTVAFDYSDAPVTLEPPDEEGGKWKVRPMKYPIQWGGHWYPVRQYIWDEKLREWIKVDDA